jgi:acyl-CoA thioesterase-1
MESVMNKRFLFLLLLLLPVPPALAARTLLVFGDSLSAAYGINPRQGWVALLQARLGQEGYDYRVVNASISGETSRGGLARIGTVLAEHRPDILILQLGANDGLRGLATEQLASNLEGIISAARNRRIAILLVGIQLPPNYGRQYTEKFRLVYPQLARRHNLALAPFLLDGIAARPELFQRDQLHPVASAQPVLLENVWKTLKPLLIK